MENTGYKMLYRMIGKLLRHLFNLMYILYGENISRSRKCQTHHCCVVISNHIFVLPSVDTQVTNYLPTQVLT